MNNSIINKGLPMFPQATNKPGSNATAGSTGSAASSASTVRAESTAAAPQGDQLKLTDSTRALQEAARQQDTAPVDGKRVDQIRRALADGSYKVDTGRIADRMMAMDQQLGGTGKA